MAASDLEKQAKTHLDSGEASLAADAAKKAVELYRGSSDTRGLRGALDILIQASSLQKMPGEGLRVAHQELERIRGSGDQSGEAEILEMLMHNHALMGEPISSMKYGKEALDLYRSKDNQKGQAAVLQTMAEMSHASGDMADAQGYAEKATKLFKALGDKVGEDQALTTLSKVLVDRGFSEKAPKRKDALKALRDLTKAIDTKNVDAMSKAEAEVDSMSHLIEDADIQEVLHAALLKDPTNIEFLEERGWTVPREQDEGTNIKQYPHKAFYLNTVMVGMGFGPQFRVAHPHRLNDERPFGHKAAVSVGQLAETEAWQMELGYRPGMLDCALQHLGVIGFP